MAETETLVREQDSLEIKSATYLEGVLLENIGNVALMTISGRSSQGLSDLGGDDRISTVSLQRDTWRYDVAEWLEAWAAETPATDMQELTDETFRIISLLDAYDEGKNEVRSLERQLRELGSAEGKLDALTADMSKVIEEEIEKRGGREVVAASKELQDQLLALASDIQDALILDQDGRLEEMSATTDAKAEQLDASVGAELDAFKLSGDATIKKLIRPVRHLVKVQMIIPGDIVSGLINRHVKFGPGNNSQKMSGIVPVDLNAAQIPVTVEDVPELTSRIREEAKKKPSIWA